MPTENHLVALAKTMQASSAEPVLRSLANHFIGSVCYMGRRGSNYTMDDLRAEVAAFHDAEAIVARRFAEASYPPMIVRDVLPKGGDEPCAQTTSATSSQEEKPSSASNGANATEPAPTLQGLLAQLDAIIESEINRCEWCQEGSGRCTLRKDHEGLCRFPIPQHDPSNLAPAILAAATGGNPA